MRLERYMVMVSRAATFLAWQIKRHLTMKCISGEEYYDGKVLVLFSVQSWMY